MKESLPLALKLMFGDEGSYSNRATDAGGPTKYGITQKTLSGARGKPASVNDVKRLTLDEAEAIYRRSYWGPSGGDVLPRGLDYAAFDFGVNSGPVTAVKHLQRVLGVLEDGWIGEDTLGAVDAFSGGVVALIKAYCDERMAYFKSLKKPGQGFKENGRGWTIRLTGVDPKGEWASKPGVVGNAIAMAEATSIVKAKDAIVEAPESLPVGGDSKAVPAAPNPWTKPEVLLPAAGVAGTGAVPFIPQILGSNYVQIALSVGVVVLILLGAFYAFRRIQKSVP